MCDQLKSVVDSCCNSSLGVIDAAIDATATTTIIGDDSNDDNTINAIDLCDKHSELNDNKKNEKLTSDNSIVDVISINVDDNDDGDDHDNIKSMTAASIAFHNKNNNDENNRIETAAKVVVVQQKLELIPKTVESESQTDITVTNNYCKQNNDAVVIGSGIVIPLPPPPGMMFKVDTNTMNTTDIVDSMMKSTADDTNNCNESGSNNMSINNNNNNDSIAVNMNINKTVSQNHNESNELKLNNMNVNSVVNNNNNEMDFIEEPEMSLIEIKEKLIEIENKNNEKTADSESEEDDQLKPLMTFNHAVIDNQEYYSYAMGHSHHQYVKHIEPKDSYNSSSDNDVMLQQQQQDCRMTSLQQHQLQQQQQKLQKQYQGPENFDMYHHIHDFKDTGFESNQSQQQKNGAPLIKEIDTIPPSEIPDDQMCENIVEQVEFYFSNESILRDAFLLKHVRRNKEGFVSLKLISSFKRVRQLTKDWRVVGYAIQRKSRKIELNDLGTKIRRLEPLPSFDETMPSRTIVACDLPVDKLCIEKVSDIFSKCGEIALIRILRPGMGIPVDVRQFMNKYPEMQQKECALVEFVESISARNALNLNGNFEVYEMVAPRKKTGKKATSVTKMIENYKFIDHNYERSRGGGGGGSGGSIDGGRMNMNTSLENNYKYNNTIRRNSADFYTTRSDQQQYQHQQQQPMQLQQSMHIYSPRRYSFNENSNKNNNNNNNNMSNNNNNNNVNNEMINYGPYSPRRISSCSMGSNDYSRKYSSCSEGYSSCSELSRRTSTCSSSDQSRRTSNCSDYCPCSRRSSQCSDIYRRMSQCSEHNHIQQRKFSNGSGVFSNSPNIRRRISMDSNYERKISTGSIGSNGGGNTGNGNNGGLIMHDQQQQQQQYRKYSNGGGFDINHKLSSSDQYYNDRRISIDSGYDRKLSFSSDYSSSPRSRSNSFLMCHQHKNIENVVRTPIGPDGSKGFTTRTRKLGQIVPPV